MWLRDTDWRPTDVLFRKRSVVTGEKISGEVMTRLVNGKRYYREMTEKELSEYWCWKFL